MNICLKYGIFVHYSDAAMDKGCSERNERVSNHLKSWLGHMCALVNEFSYEPKSTLRKLLMFFL